MKSLHKFALTAGFLLMAVLPAQSQGYMMNMSQMQQHHQVMMNMMTEYEKSMNTELQALKKLKGEAKVNKLEEIVNVMYSHQVQMHGQMLSMQGSMMNGMQNGMMHNGMMNQNQN